MRTLLLSIALLLQAAALPAQDHAPRPLQEAPQPMPACIEVEVDGVRTPAWNCLQKKLAPAPAQGAARPLSEAERLMRQPGNQMLQYNLEGTRQRMGNALGTSVQPQRPAR